MTHNLITKEIKDEILGKVKLGESASSLSRHYDISDKTIYKWLKEGVNSTVSIVEFRRVKFENQKLKEIIGVLTYELERVKKKTNH